MSIISRLLEEISKEEKLNVANQCLNMYKGGEKTDDLKGLRVIVTEQADAYEIGAEELYNLVLNIAKERNISI